MIVALQQAAGITVTEEEARAGWRSMGAFDRDQTALAYRAVALKEAGIGIVGRR
jgi:hypothetical protein